MNGYEDDDALPDDGGNVATAEAPQAPSQAPASPFPKGPGDLLPLFAGVDKFDQALPEQARTNLAPILHNALDPQGQRQRIANQILLSQRYNKTPGEIAENYELYRDDFAKKAFGLEQADDASFYQKAGVQLKKEKGEADMMGGMYGPMYQAFISEKPQTQVAFMKGYLPTLQKDPNYDPAHLDLYYQHAADQWNNFERFSSDHHDAISAVQSYLSLASTELAGDAKRLPDKSRLDPLRDDAVSALASLSPSDQALVISLGQRGIHTPEEEGIQKFAGRFSRGAEHLVKGAYGLTGDILDMMPGTVTDPALNAAKHRAERLLTTSFETGVDPMQAQGLVGKAILGTAENLPPLAASFSGPGLALNLASSTHELTGHYEDQGISHGKALSLATVGAAAQTASQFVSAHLIEGKIPGLSDWISNLPSKVLKVGAIGGLETVTLGTMSAAQAKIPDWTQELAGSFDETLPKVKEDPFWNHVKDPVAALELLPLVLVGTGAGAFRHGAFAKSFLTSERVQAAGYPPDIAEKITSAATPEAAETLLEQNAPKREFDTPAQRQAMADVEAKQTPAGYLPPNHVPVTIKRGDGTTYAATMNGYYEGLPGRGDVPSIGRYTEGGLSHGLLNEDESIVTPHPDAKAWAEGVRTLGRDAEPEESITSAAGLRNAQISDGSGTPTPYEEKMLADWKAQIQREQDGTFLVRDQDGQPVAHLSSPEMAAKAVSDLAAQSPSQRIDLSDLEDGKAPGIADALKSQPLGIVDQASQTVMGWLNLGLRSAREVAKFARDVPKLEGFKRIINEWAGNQELATLRMKPFLQEVKRIAPSRVTREGIANFIDAGGDEAALRAGIEGTSKASVKRGYEAALKLTPDQKELASRIKTWFDQQFERAKAAGIMEDEDFRNNYVTQMIDRPFVGGGVKSEFFGKLSKNFQYSEARTFPNFGELEKAGFDVSTKDIGEIMAKYEVSLTRAIETRRMVDALTSTKDKDGYPLAFRGKPPEGVDIDYEKVDHPSLRGISLNPEIASHLKNILGRSAISDWYEQSGSPALQAGKAVLKAVDESNRYFANTMLSGVSPFHLVHEAKRAAGSGTNVFNMEPLDPEDSRLQRALRTGLSVTHANSAVAEFTEGLGGHQSLTDRIPGVAQVNRAIGHLTFDVVIPRLKFTTWVKYEARNMEHFSKEIEAGKISKDDVSYLTSQQVNARFGHLNAADLGKNPTIRHLARMVTLAPDFWESNVRNYGQVLSGLTLSKAGAEPLKAFLLTGAVTWGLARAINAAINDDHDPHFEEPFGVVHNGRAYTMRSETEDLVRMVKGFKQSFEGGGRNTYLAGRFSPVFGSMIDMLSGSNWRGEKQSTVDSFRDYLAKIVPLSFRGIPGVRQAVDELSGTERNRTITTLQEMLGNFGIQVARRSDLNEAYQMAGQWKKSNGNKEDTGVYPVSKYQGLRYALEDADFSRAQDEIKKLGPKTAADFKEMEKGVHGSLLRPWTGSKKDDEAFFKSLGQKEQAKLLQAEWHRETMFHSFQQQLTNYAKDQNVPYHPSMSAIPPSWAHK